MNRITEIYDRTTEMLQLFEKWDANEVDREQIIENIVQLIEIREQLINTLQEPYIAEEVALGKKIISLNNKLENKMTRLFETVKTDIKKVKEKKELNYSYINSYGGMKTIDGMYVDNKL